MAATKATPKKTKVITTREVKVTLPVVKVPGFLQGFIDFVREQGVVGLAIGFVIGAQIKALVDQLVASFINPLLGLALPGKGNLAEKVFHVTFRGKQADFMYGAFIFQLISFLIVALLIYVVVKKLKLDKLDKKKEA
jgi:large conductance mechanosensitive channel protein